MYTVVVAATDWFVPQSGYHFFKTGSDRKKKHYSAGPYLFAKVLSDWSDNVEEISKFLSADLWFEESTSNSVK